MSGGNELPGNQGVLNFGNLKAAVSRLFRTFGDKKLFPHCDGQAYRLDPHDFFISSLHGWK